MSGTLYRCRPTNINHALTAQTMQYRRNQQSGLCYFISRVSHQRQPVLIQANIDRLRLAFKAEILTPFFPIDGTVILPDHLHTLWQRRFWQHTIQEQADWKRHMYYE